MTNDAAAAPVPRWADPRPWAWVLAAVPAALAVAALGRLHPDEVYQFLEPAYFRAHGYGVLAWEWRQGLRNWAAPLLLSVVLRIGSWVGIHDPWWARGLLAVPIGLLQGWGLLCAARLGLRRAGIWGGWTALLALGLLPLFRVFAGRTLGESLSAALLVVAAEALSRDEEESRAGWVGGLALGLAFVVRYGSLPAMALAAVWVVARRRWQLLAWAGAGLVVVLLALGALDWVSWGRPWHSVLAWASFNVLSDGAARTFGREPASFYLPFLLGQVPLWVWPGLGLTLLFCRPRLGIAGTMAVGMLAALQSTAHKEERFLYPVVVLLALEAAPGVGALLGKLRRPVTRAAVAVLALVSTFRAAPPSVDLRGDEFRALVRAARPPDVRGLLIVNEGLWGAGGYFYLGKRIPWLNCDWPHEPGFVAAMRDPRINRVITFEGRALAELQSAGFHVVGEEGRETILAR